MATSSTKYALRLRNICDEYDFPLETSNKCFINSSIQLIDNMDLNNFRRRRTEGEEDDVTDSLLNLLITRDISNISGILNVHYHKVQEDSAELLLAILDKISNFISLNVKIRTSFLICKNPEDSPPQEENYPLLMLQLTGETIQNCILQYQNIEKIDVESNCEYKKNEILPTGNDLIIQLTRFNNDRGKNLQKVVPDNYIQFTNNNIYKLKGCIIHHGDHSTETGHYSYLHFDKEGNSGLWLDDLNYKNANNYDKNNKNYSNYETHGYIYLYKLVTSDTSIPEKTPAKSISEKTSAKSITEKTPPVPEDFIDEIDIETETDKEYIYKCYKSTRYDDVIFKIDQQECKIHDIKKLRSTPTDPEKSKLNDEIMNLWMFFLQFISPTNYYFSTFFFSKLFENNIYNYDMIKRWIRYENLFQKDKLFIPINQGRGHWILIVISMKNRTIKYYDSLGGKSQLFMEIIVSFLTDLHAERKVDFDKNKWGKIFVEDIPQQDNFIDCGVYVCLYAYFITKNYPIIFKNNISHYRIKIAQMLIERGRTCKNFSLCVGGGDYFINMSKLGFKTLGNHNGAFVKKEWKDLNENDANSFKKRYGSIRFLCIDQGTNSWLPIPEVLDYEKGKKPLVDFLRSVTDKTNFTFVFMYQEGLNLLNLFDPLIKSIEVTKYLFVLDQYYNGDFEKYIIISTNYKIGEYYNLCQDLDRLTKTFKIINNSINNNVVTNYMGVNNIISNREEINRNKTDKSYQEILQYIYNNIHTN